MSSVSEPVRQQPFLDCAGVVAILPMAEVAVPHGLLKGNHALLGSDLALADRILRRSTVTRDFLVTPLGVLRLVQIAEMVVESVGRPNGDRAGFGRDPQELMALCGERVEKTSTAKPESPSYPL
jgi:hypothetical protein